MKFSVGQQVFILCAKVDPYGVDDENSEPAIDTYSFRWLAATVIGPGEESYTVEVRTETGATTDWEIRFVLAEPIFKVSAPPTAPLGVINPTDLVAALKERKRRDPDAPDAIAWTQPSPTMNKDIPGDPIADMDADDEEDYELLITDQAFEPGSYGGWTIQFTAIGAPRLSYQKSDPSLEAYLPLERAEPDAPKLTSGGSSALARTDDAASRLTEAMLAGGPEGQVLRGFAGAAVVESQPVVFGNAPVALPSEERVLEACQKVLRVHIAAVREEQKRLAVTEGADSIVGKRLRTRL